MSTVFSISVVIYSASRSSPCGTKKGTYCAENKTKLGFGRAAKIRLTKVFSIFNLKTGTGTGKDSNCVCVYCRWWPSVLPTCTSWLCSTAPSGTSIWSASTAAGKDTRPGNARRAKMLPPGDTTRRIMMSAGFHIWISIGSGYKHQKILIRYRYLLKLIEMFEIGKKYCLSLMSWAVAHLNVENCCFL